jgi:hypothetical protein
VLETVSFTAVVKSVVHSSRSNALAYQLLQFSPCDTYVILHLISPTNISQISFNRLARTSESRMMKRLISLLDPAEALSIMMQQERVRVGFERLVLGARFSAPSRIVAFTPANQISQSTQIIKIGQIPFLGDMVYTAHADPVRSILHRVRGSLLYFRLRPYYCGRKCSGRLCWWRPRYLSSAYSPVPTG